MNYELNKECRVTVWHILPNATKFSVKTADGQYIEVPIAGELLKRITSGSVVTVVCTGVGVDGTPSFELVKSYYATMIARGEGKTVEFKQSIIFSPETHQPSASQPLQIAKEIAAFMNSEGGTLYLGVDDHGKVVGIENDLPHLGEAVLKKDDYTDAQHTYHANLDGFGLKLHALIRFYLGNIADTLVEGPEFLKSNGDDHDYAILKVHPSERDVIYWRNDEVCYRSGAASVLLVNGRERDNYLRQRFYERTDVDYQALLENFVAKQRAENERLRQELTKLTEALENDQGLPLSYVDKGPVPISPGSYVSLADEHFGAVTTIKGIIYKAGTSEQKIGHAETWKEFYEQLLVILSELFPVKFSQLPDLKDFKPTRRTVEPYFLRKGTRKKLSAPSKYLGLEGDIRANLKCAVNKAAFQNARSIPMRLLTYFAISPADIAVMV